MANHESALQAQVIEAFNNESALAVQGGGSKLVAKPPDIETLDLTAHSGIVDYSPSELVVVVRAGTPLKELQAELAKNDQLLGFEPPYASSGATIGGVIATGFCGSARPYYGAARDFILGAKIINGKGEILQFGGKVMKNVAGFDLFRPMAGAMGTLGVLLEVSLRLIPKPRYEIARKVECLSPQEGIRLMNQWGKQCLSMTAAYWDDGHCMLRLSGSEEAVSHDKHALPESSEIPATLFSQLDHRTHPFFSSPLPLYRCSVKPAQGHLALSGTQLLDWGGAQRFVATDTPIESLQEQLASLGGRVVRLEASHLYSPLALMPQSLSKIHDSLRLAMDPKRILNPHINGLS